MGSSQSTPQSPPPGSPSAESSSRSSRPSMQSVASRNSLASRPLPLQPMYMEQGPDSRSPTPPAYSPVDQFAPRSPTARNSDVFAFHGNPPGAFPPNTSTFPSRESGRERHHRGHQQSASAPVTSIPIAGGFNSQITDNSAPTGGRHRAPAPLRVAPPSPTQWQRASDSPTMSPAPRTAPPPTSGQSRHGRENPLQLLKK